MTNMEVKSRRKPMNDRAGYVASRRNGLTGGWLVIYRADESGLDPSGGPWVTSCETHATLCNHTSLKKARESMKSPDFCEACMALRQAAPCSASTKGADGEAAKAELLSATLDTASGMSP